MDRSLYIAMNGAKQTQLAQTANANNLGHAQTTGFKADFQQFRAMPEFGPGYPSRVYTMTERPGSDFTPGGIQTTGRELDVAIMDERGWFAVSGEGGKEAYSKAGNLMVTQQGNLKSGDGQLILNDAGTPIAIPPARKIDVGRDGTISIIPEGANSNTLVVVDRIKLVSTDKTNLSKGKDGLMYAKDGNLAADANVKLQAGALEGSNVNIVSEMVEMIELGRHFEMQTKVMKSVDNNASASAKLMQMA
jgi:flagellar basal-body rod protein FlgF